MSNIFQQEIHPDHYYGDIVRMLFLLCALIMLFGLPAISNYLSLPTGLSILSILVLVIAAGLTSPRYMWSAVVNTVVGAIGFVIFEFATLQSFATRAAHGEFFISNLALSSMLLVATYFGVKTIRGFYKTTKTL